ncbi:hypothetical protein BRAO375_3780012 [Bradyrhizobium sp. ORS 375]|nr:hypothetical protein BRAO375_3780012 [Bradyrhizobium sp. ORS 375]
MATQLTPTNLGRYQIASNNGNTFDFCRPYGKIQNQDTKTVAAWGVNYVPGQPCLVVLQLVYNGFYLIPYALMKGNVQTAYPILQAVAYDFDQAYQWMFTQGSLGSIVYRDDSKSLILDNARWVFVNWNSYLDPPIIGYNGTGAPDESGFQFTTQKVG